MKLWGSSGSKAKRQSDSFFYPQQFGFKPSKSTTYVTFALRMLVEYVRKSCTGALWI